MGGSNGARLIPSLGRNDTQEKNHVQEKEGQKPLGRKRDTGGEKQKELWFSRQWAKKKIKTKLRDILEKRGELRVQQGENGRKRSKDINILKKTDGPPGTNIKGKEHISIRGGWGLKINGEGDMGVQSPQEKKPRENPCTKTHKRQRMKQASHKERSSSSD